MRPALDLDARALGALYDEGYYHGVNSGYPSAGYESEHATWMHWVEHLARAYPAGARWLDLGCAYGYLVGEASAGGFRATGLDVSAYALARASSEAPAARGRLTRGMAEALPFPDHSFDVVSAFDVLEHLADPDAALREAARVLRAGGALLGATPDPLFFDRHETTHVSERPPSYWIDRLLALGFAVDFRFFQAPYNLELLALREGAPRLVPAARLRTNGFGGGPDLGVVRGPAAEHVAVRVRAGAWARLDDASGPAAYWLGAGEALAYVAITGRAPARLGVTLEIRGADGDAEVTLALDDQRLATCRVGSTWRLLEAEPIPAPAGGHHLRLRTSAPLLVRQLEVEAAPVEREHLLARLPFDVYQRYDQCRAVVSRLAANGRRILDVGGVLGRAGAHLATTADFFPGEPPPRSTDVRASDHPDHLAVEGQRLPFADASFDLVLCQGVLEHVPPAQRPAMQEEWARVSARFVLLAAPFATPGVVEADALLLELVRVRHGYRNGFLADLDHGHPDLSETVAFWEGRGASVVVLPNGYLPYWSLMQLLNLRLVEPAMGVRYARAQARYNGVVADWREPAYRHLLVIDLAGGREWCDAVRSLAADPRAVSDAVAHACDAAALDAIVDLALASDPGPGGLAEAHDATGTHEAAAAAAGAGAGVEATAAGGIGATSGGATESPAALRERTRLEEAARFADRVWAHPAYRLYARVRRWWRGVRET